MSYKELYDSGMGVDDIHRSNQPEWVDKPKRPTIKSKPTAAEAIQYAKDLTQYESDLEQYKLLKAEYDKVEIEHHDKMVDLLWHIAGDVPEQYRDKVFAKAWSDGHSGGWNEVLYHLHKLVDIFK